MSPRNANSQVSAAEGRLDSIVVSASMWMQTGAASQVTPHRVAAPAPAGSEGQRLCSGICDRLLFSFWSSLSGANDTCLWLGGYAKAACPVLSACLRGVGLGAQNTAPLVLPLSGVSLCLEFEGRH